MVHKMKITENLVVLFLCVFIPKDSAQQTPTIRNITQTQIKDVGDTVELSCTVENAQDYPIKWVKVDPKSNVSSLPLSESRYSLGYDDSANSTYTLRISDIKMSDAGSYSCRIQTGSSHRVSAEVELKVRGLPRILRNSTWRIYALEGDDVELNCYSVGYPPPWIIWRRRYFHTFSSGALRYKGNTVELKNISKTNEGTYYCTAWNDLGCSPERRIDVFVRIVPAVTVPNGTVCQTLHNPVELQCEVRSDPRPTVEWLKDGVSLDDGQNYSISHVPRGSDVVVSKLEIDEIEQSQYGEYVCKATNKVGSAEGKVVVIESSIGADGCS